MPSTNNPYPFNENSSSLRRRLPAWIRPTHDILEFMASLPGVKEALQERQRHEIRNLVVNVIVRIDPYKAPEQYALESDLIAQYLWENVLHVPQPVYVEDVFPVLKQMEEDERNGE